MEDMEEEVEAQEAQDEEGDGLLKRRGIEEEKERGGDGVGIVLVRGRRGGEGEGDGAGVER